MRLARHLPVFVAGLLLTPSAVTQQSRDKMPAGVVSEDLKPRIIFSCETSQQRITLIAHNPAPHGYRFALVEEDKSTRESQWSIGYLGRHVQIGDFPEQAADACKKAVAEAAKLEL